MIWGLFAVIFILVLAYAIRRGVQGTHFQNKCPCTPMIDHLRWVEDGEKRENAKRENLW